MALKAYEQSFQVALASLAAPAVDVSALTSAPQAALLLQGITILAACVIDASLDNDRTKNAIKLFKITQSFEAYRVADRAMLNIKINLEEIPHILTSIVSTFVKVKDKDSTYLMNLQMEKISELLKNCSQEAKNARQAFSDALPLIQEMQQVAAKLKKETYKYQKFIELKLLEQDSGNRKTLAEIAAKMAGTELETLNFEDIIKYISGDVLIGHVEEHWSILLDFFSTFESVVIGPMIRNLKTFDKIAQMSELSESRVLRNGLAESGFRAAALSLNIAKSAGIYNQVYKKYVMPLIAELTGKLTMSTEEAKTEFSKMEQITKGSNKFIDEKIQEALKEAINQMVHFKDELKLF